MTEEQKEQVRQLVREKRYQEAREVLKAIDSTAARRMLHTLEASGVLETGSQPKRWKTRKGFNWYVLIPLLIAMLVLVSVVLQLRQQGNRWKEVEADCIARYGEEFCDSPYGDPEVASGFQSCLDNGLSEEQCRGQAIATLVHRR
jgi:hypothetical protein